MNYFLTRQGPTSTRIGSVLKTKRGEDVNFYCQYCLRSHTIFQTFSREVSTNASALKLKLQRRRLEKNISNSHRWRRQMHPQIISKFLNISSSKDRNRSNSPSKKKLPPPGEVIGATELKNNHSFDSTKSYDPNLLDCSPKIENFYKYFGTNPKFTSLYKSDNSSLEKKLQGMSDAIFKHLDTVNDNLQTTNSIDNKKCFDENLKKNDIFKLLLKPAQKQPVKVPEKVTATQDKENGLKIDLNNITFSCQSDYSFHHVIESSIDVLILNEMLLPAYDLICLSRKRPKWESLSENDKLHLYNTLLYALSVKGKLSHCKSVTQWMEKDQVRLDGESYASLLLCLWKTRDKQNMNSVYQDAVHTVNRLLQQNIPINDIFSKSRLTKEELEIVLDLVRKVVPNFEIQPVKIDLSSDCSITKDLHLSSSNLSPPLENFETEHMNSLVEEQLEIEKKFFTNIKVVPTGNKSDAYFRHKISFDMLRNRWQKSLTEAVSNLKRIHSETRPSNPYTFNLNIFLNSVPAEKLVEILLETTLNLIKYCGDFSPTCGYLSKMLGSNVYQCYQIKKAQTTGLSDATDKLFKNYTSWLLNPHGPARNSRQKWQLLIQDSDKSHHLDSQVDEWPSVVLNSLGKCLLDIILKEVKFTTLTRYGEKDLPVLYTVLRYRKIRFDEEVKAHPTITKMLQRIGIDEMCFRADEMPMVCPPKPWKSVNHGGYLLLNTKLIRPVGGLRGKRINFKRIPDKKMFDTFDSLNALQTIPWRINEGVLDVALEVFRNGGSEELDIPKYPYPVEVKHKIPENLSFLEMMEERSRRRELQRQALNHYGLWCEALYRLSLAEHFRHRIFWFPQNCDFRGRVYPVAPLLNHLGSDVFRSLLLFAKGKPLGPKGLDWLKIHVINLTGTRKKSSVEDRLAYANEIMPYIIDSAENPLTGDKWWTESDDPWQTLATCMEIKKAISAPNPEEYVCHLPVHQDGSCNGLQHYAALGRDVAGAKSVNLTSCDLPQDVYAVVVELIEEERVADAMQGVEIAKILEGFIGRKVVKQTIMTTVYGVTLYGAKLQIRKRLEEIPDFPKEYITQASLYLSTKAFLCLKKMFTSAREIQDWFISCAADICKRGDYVQWVTPLGLPVLQPYAKHALDPKTRKRIVAPDTLKQKNAFPPNFIHSLDSCHMMLTALHCEQAGITFAAVHDCFWTHPCTVDKMNQICREQFVTLHSQTILEDLSKFFKKTYVNNKFSRQPDSNVFEKVPEKGDYDLKEVMNSVYFFS